MVREITSWEAEDGTIHRTQLEAAEHDAVEQLKKMDIFNHASALAIVKQCEHVLPILQQVVDAGLPRVLADRNTTGGRG